MHGVSFDGRIVIGVIENRFKSCDVVSLYVETRRASGKFSKMNTLLPFARSAFLLALWLGAASSFAQQGADKINENGQLVMAARAGNTSRVAALLKEGAAANSRDRNGDTPLNMAAAKGNAELARLLVRAGADVNLANLSGVTPLMAASFSSSPGIVRDLLAAGASIQPHDRVSKTAAVYAAAQGCTDCVEALLKAGAPVNAPVDGGLTLLMWAAGYGREDTTRVLLQRGADPGLRDERGKTAEDMARENGYAALASSLHR